MTVAELVAPWISGGGASAAVASAETEGQGQTSRPTLPPHVRLLFWSSAMAGLDWVSFPDKKGRSMVRVGALVMRDMLKVDNDTCRDVRLLLDGSEAFTSLCEQSRQGGADSASPPSRLACGLVVRAAKELWRVALWLACARELAAAHGAPVAVYGPVPEPNTLVRLSPNQADVIRSYSALEALVSGTMHLDGCWAMRPLFDGQSLQRELGTLPLLLLLLLLRLPSLFLYSHHLVCPSAGIKAGQKVGQALDRQMRWQLQHERGSSEECLLYLQSILGEL